MKNFCLFIKTYSKDLKHLIVLLNSIEKYNKDKIDVVICVPETEFVFFREQLKSFKVEKIYKDEEIN